MKKKTKKYLGIGVIVLVVLVWLIWSNQRIEVTQYTVESENLPHAFDDYTIVQISDLHNASFGKGQKDLLEKIVAEKPNIIAITGDLIDSDHTDVKKAMELVKGAVKVAPVYYVSGNHEAWSKKYPTLWKEMLKSGVNILTQGGVPQRRAGETIMIYGLDDPCMGGAKEFEGDEEAKLASGMARYEKEYYTILLSHRPEYFKNYVARNMDLVLAGHAHGGQVRIPFIGGVYAPGQGFFPKYTAGTFTDKNTTMVVSRGLGNSAFPVRVNDSPELVVVHLKSTMQEE